jgi:hypothetical protein
MPVIPFADVKLLPTKRTRTARRLLGTAATSPLNTAALELANTET